MNKESRQDCIDPVLAKAYAELRDEAHPDVDWDALRIAIGARAEPILARRSGHRFARMARPLVPFALAASLAFGLWIGPPYVREVFTPEQVAVAADMDAEEILVHAVDDAVSDQELRNLMSGRSNPEAFLALAVSEP